MRSVGFLLIRVVVGGLIAGHGAQKLFGAFGGAGIEGTTGWLASMRLRPAGMWARAAGGSEFFGGLLTAVGFLNPIGPVMALGAMAMAWAKVHLGRPVWVTEGGAELPLTNMAVLSAITLAGPGRLSLDALFGIRLPRWIGATALAAMFAGLWLGAREELEQGAGSLVEKQRELIGVFDVPSPDAAADEAADEAADDATDQELDDSFPASDPPSRAQPATVTPEG
jgi:putative oxidoreductase